MVEERKVGVALIDDHPLFRMGLAAVLRSATDVECIGEAGNADEALALIGGRGDIDIAVVDVLMPGTSGITIAHEIRELAPDCKILGLSVIDEPCLIADMLRAGASGFALKTEASEAIIEAIRRVAGGVRYLPPAVSRDAIETALAVGPQRPFDKLTRREREIFELMIRGHGNMEIAGMLFISARTVETHRQRIMKKLSARSIVELQRLVARYGAS